MLYIDFFGTQLKEVGIPREYIEHWGNPREWFEDPFVKEMVLGVDKSEVLSYESIRSPVLGNIGYHRLSGGVLALVVAYKTDKIINYTRCGDNCDEWLIKIAEKKPEGVKVIANRLPLFTKDRDFEGIIMNTGFHFYTYRDYILESLAVWNERRKNWKEEYEAIWGADEED